MTRTKSIAIAFYLGAALVGAAIGVSVDRVAFRAQPHWYDRRELRTRLWDDLHLGQGQRDSANTIFDERNRADSVLTAPVRPSTDSVNTQAHQKFLQLLKPEQRAIYDQIERGNAPRTEKK